MPTELDNLRAEVAVLRARLNQWEQFLPSSWYSANTFISPDTLLKARRHIRHRRIGGRWRWHAGDAFHRYPDKWLHPMTMKPPAMPCP